MPEKIKQAIQNKIIEGIFNMNKMDDYKWLMLAKLIEDMAVSKIVY